MNILLIFVIPIEFADAHTKLRGTLSLSDIFSPKLLSNNTHIDPDNLTLVSIIINCFSNYSLHLNVIIHHILLMFVIFFFFLQHYFQVKNMNNILDGGMNSPIKTFAKLS
ncbi:MAG: hypothetical protein J6Y96_00485 [Mycoplasma sp.]|nr:hypothetical protein [Mycoplasma sp.]